MPLSKAKQAEYMRDYRAKLRATVIPKHAVGYLYPDGRVRLEDMSVVQPNQCVTVKVR